MKRWIHAADELQKGDLTATKCEDGTWKITGPDGKIIDDQIPENSIKEALNEYEKEYKEQSAEHQKYVAEFIRFCKQRGCRTESPNGQEGLVGGNVDKLAKEFNDKHEDAGIKVDPELNDDHYVYFPQ